MGGAWGGGVTTPRAPRTVLARKNTGTCACTVRERSSCGSSDMRMGPGERQSSRMVARPLRTVPQNSALQESARQKPSLDTPCVLPITHRNQIFKLPSSLRIPKSLNFRAMHLRICPDAGPYRCARRRLDLRRSCPLSHLVCSFLLDLNSQWWLLRVVVGTSMTSAATLSSFFCF